MSKKKFPHIDDTEFPDVQNVNVYKYENEVDYSLYHDNIKIKMLNVSWCGDYENVVYFENKQARDEWFDDQVITQKSPVREMNTMFRLYSRGDLKVELPIDEAMQFNYVMVDYGKLPNQANKSANSRMFYFIENMEQSSVNATNLTLNIDYWTTYIYDMGITYVNLLRGHAPMASTNVDTYLSNPIENSEYLLTPDVNYGDGLQKFASGKNVILNDTNELYLCFATSGNVDGSWGNTTNTRAMYSSQELSNIQVIGCNLSDWDIFRNNVESQLPQFLQTVKAMFIVPKKLLSTSGTLTLCGVTFYHFLPNTNKKIDSYKFTKNAFGYDEKYSHIAKLYTYPYSAIEVNDFKGNTTIIRVEECGSELGMYVVTNLMYPFINTEAYITGIGGGNVNNLSFFQASGNNFNIGGRDYNFGTQWDIPMFGVQLTSNNDWVLNGKIGADSSKANADASALTSKNNSQDSINTSNTNNVNSINLNNDIQAESISLNYYNGKIQNYFNYTAAVVGDKYDRQKFNAGWQAEGQVAMQNQFQIMGNMITGTAGAIASKDLLGGAMNIGSNLLQSASINRTMSAKKEVTEIGLEELKNMTLIYYADKEETVLPNGSTHTQEWNDLDADGMVMMLQHLNSDKQGNWRDRNYSLSIANQQRNYNTDINNNNRSYNQSIANNNRSYNASYNQKLLSNHPEFGGGGGTPDICDKPMGIRYNVITQSKNSIRQAAEQFLRYGYMFNMEWDITSFNLMPKFTYWQCDVVYCNDNGVYEGAQNQIKNILNNGVTVWKNPNEIGLVSIYSNK